MAFHDVRFPTAISLGATGGPERRTDVVVLGSGHEERNARWADSKRSYNAGYGVKKLADLQAVVAFFEERRGRLYGFRWKDWTDFKSCAHENEPTALDQEIGGGDGERTTFQLMKRYGLAFAPYAREITKPVASSVLVAVDGVLAIAGEDYVVSGTSGTVNFTGGSVPAEGAIVTAGFEFDVPVRFDTDRLEINLSLVDAGEIPNIPIVEIRT